MMMMMMMMMVDELTLTWHIVLRLQGHVTVKKSHVIVDALVDGTSRNSCMSMYVSAFPCCAARRLDCVYECGKMQKSTLTGEMIRTEIGPEHLMWLTTAASCLGSLVSSNSSGDKDFRICKANIVLGCIERMKC